MANAIVFAKMLELRAGKCCPIVGYQDLWQTQHANVLRIFSIVTSEVAELVMWMSIHFVPALTEIRNILSKKGPA